MLICMSAVLGATGGLLEKRTKSAKERRQNKGRTYLLETNDLSTELLNFEELLLEGEDFPL